MELTLEQIELVKDRTGASYKEAKEALEFAGGNVVDAIIYIEDNIDGAAETKETSKVDDLKDFIVNAVKKGQANRIKIYKNDELLVNLPLTAGIVGLAVFTWWGIIVAVLATGITKCRVELVKEDGTIIDITDKASDAFETVKDKGGVLADEVAGATGDLYETAKAKGIDIYAAAKDSVNNLIKKSDDAADMAEDVDAEMEEIAEEMASELSVPAGDVAIDASEIKLDFEEGIEKNE